MTYNEKKCVVFYESWQMECCGMAFETGDNIKWLVYNCDSINSSVDLGKVNYFYEAHDSDWKNLFMLEGTAERIQMLYERRTSLEDNKRLLFPVDGKLIESDRAEGFEKPVDGMELSGYLVDIVNFTIRPAKKEEVTYK